MEIYIKENNELKQIDPFSFPYCGLYAAIGYDKEQAGNLFVCHCGPYLVFAYDADGKRINVGSDKAGMSYSQKYGWYNE